MKTRILFVIILMSFINTAAFSEDVVYVVNSNVHHPEMPPDPDISTVSMLRNDTFAILNTLTLPIHSAHTVAVTPDQSRIWVTSPGANRIFVIDAESFDISDTIYLGNTISYQPMGLALSPDGNFAYVTYSSRGEVGVYSTETLTHVASIAIDGYPEFIVFNPSGTRAYALATIERGHQIVSSITVIDTSDHSLITTVGPFYGAFNDAVVSPDGSHVYATNMNADQIEVIRTSDNEALTPFPTLEKPRGIGISPDGNYLFVGQYTLTEGIVSMLRLSDQEVVSSIAMPQNPRRVAVTQTGDRIIVVDHNEDEVYAFDANGENLVQRFVTSLNTFPGFHASPIGVALGKYPSPVPNIKVNGSDGPLILDSADTIQVSLHLNNNGHTELADWWLIGFSPYGRTPLFWTPTTGWTYDWLPGYQGRLYNMRRFSSPIIPVRDLAQGRYRLVFGVDLVMDGAITMPYAYSDFIDLNIVR